MPYSGVGTTAPLIVPNLGLLDAGETTMPRRMVTSTSASTGNQNLRFAYFTAVRSATISQIAATTGGTAAGATPTLVKYAVFSVAANGDLTRVGVTASDTTMLAVASTTYAKALTSSFDTVAGQRYAAGILVVTGATAPTLLGHTALTAPLAVRAPRLAGFVAAQADIAASYTAAQITDSGNIPYLELLP